MTPGRWRSVALWLAFGPVAHAQSPSPCEGPLNAERAVRCAMARSPEVQAARQELAALAGRRVAAGVLLPSQPVLSGALARRTGSQQGESALNWTVTLEQEIPLPGKRAARLAEVDAERASAGHRLRAVEQDMAAATLEALHVAAAADGSASLALELERSSAALAESLAARAGEGLVSPAEADLAAAEAVRLSIARLESDRARAVSRARLAALLGLPEGGAIPALSPAIEGGAAVSWPPDREALVARALAARADLSAAAAERQAAAARIERLRRQRIPNPVLSLFAQRDGFDERVLGGGVSIPLVLPAPLGPSGRGEIAEAEARRHQANLQIEALRRRVREEVLVGLATWQARRSALDRYPPALVERARTHVIALADAVKGRQLAPREALPTQRAFIELLQGHLQARLAEALARSELLRVAALPIPGVSP